MKKIDFSKLKIALVHEYLIKLGGAERVLKILVDLFPKADIFAIISDPKVTPKLIQRRKKIKNSFLQSFPMAKKNYQLYLWLMPAAIESLDFSKYDIIISDSHSFGKGIKTQPKTLNVCYCYTPTRYLWLNPAEHLKRWQKSSLLKKIAPWFMERLKKWDQKAAARPDVYATTCQNVQKRIKKYYNRDSEVIYSAIDWKFFHRTRRVSDFFLYISRLEPHKKPDLAVKAFNKLKLPLKVVGTGSMEAGLKKIAHKNIDFLGEISDNRLRDLYSQAKAVIFPQDEDYGLVPLEAAACGTPTIAFKKGGVLETIVENKTGIFFSKSNPESLMKAVNSFKGKKFNPKTLRAHAQKFSIKNFQNNFAKFVQKEYLRKKKSWN